MSERVQIFDTTLRDGEQAPGCSMTAEEKLRFARALAELGVDCLEAGFPIASEGDFAAVSAIARALRGTRVAALARAKRGDLERAAQALARADRPRMHTFIATSDLHLERKLKISRERALADAVAAIEFARREFDDVEFSAEDASRTDPDFLVAICRAAAEAGARTVNVPDTVGYALPGEFAALVARVVAAVRGRAVVSVHCHDDLGLAVANSLAAVSAGARQVECTLNGIGERAGNAALEEVVMALRTRRDALPYATGVDTRRLYPVSRLLASIISFGPQPNKAIVGENAFAHEAGIHQDGILKARATYEIIDPAEVGVPESRLVLGKHSGRHALAKRCADLGHPLAGEALERVYRDFIALADRGKGVRNEQIAALAAAQAAPVAAAG